MKNLPFLLRALSSLKGDVRLDTYGPKESREWDTVETVARSLPKNIEVSYGGLLRHEEIGDALARAHFFVLPTLGENFGHAIYESLRIGRPVIISDRTPWQGLENLGAGWDLPLGHRDAWVDTLQKSVDMDDQSYRLMSDAAHAYATRWFHDTNPAAQQAAVFRSLLG